MGTWHHCFCSFDPALPTAPNNLYVLVRRENTKNDQASDCMMVKLLGNSTAIKVAPGTLRMFLMVSAVNGGTRFFLYKWFHLPPVQAPAGFWYCTKLRTSDSWIQIMRNSGVFVIWFPALFRQFSPPTALQKAVSEREIIIVAIHTFADCLFRLRRRFNLSYFTWAT